jgi:uncharacterized NAD-dependent epimerase/dehydratase family protein
VLGRPRRLALLAQGSFTPLDAKTAVGVLRYRPHEVAAVIDSTRAGSSAAACVGVGGAIPVVAGLEAAARAGADSLLIGIAPQGGDLPPAWREVVRAALARGWDVIAGLHVFLADDPEFAALAASSGAQLIDARRPPLARALASGRAADSDALIVLTVGSDCNVGKMTAALEILNALTASGARAAFVATGQTGIFIADRGVAVDAMPADFAAGAIETLVLEAARDADIVMVEGQGALRHPAYSGVTLALLHGAAPAALVLCHASGRDAIRFAGEDRAIPPLQTLRAEYEQAASWVAGARVRAIALNTLGRSDDNAREECASAVRSTGLPATDPVRFGAAPIAEALMTAWSERRAARAARAKPADPRRGHPGGTHATHS